MAVTFNVFVKDVNTNNGIPNARVTALTRNQIIDPPVRQTSGDGGCNLYYQGPSFNPPVAVSLIIDAEGYAPWSTEDAPIQLGSNTINYNAFLKPSFKKPSRESILNVRANFCNLRDADDIPIFESFINYLILYNQPKANDWINRLKAAGSTHINLALSIAYNENLGWTDVYPIPSLDLTNKLNAFNYCINYVQVRGLIPVVHLAFDGQDYDPVGWTYGWQWGMNNFERIANALGDNADYILWNAGFDGCFPDWSPDQFLQMYQFMRDVLGTNACLDAEFGGPQTWGYIHLGDGQADWTPNKLGILDCFSIEAKSWPIDMDGLQQIATRLLGPNCLIGPKEPYYLIDIDKPITINMFETNAYTSIRKQTTPEDAVNVANVCKSYGFNFFGNGLPT